MVRTLALKLYKSECGDEDVYLEDGRRRAQFRVQLFGTTPKGRTVCLNVTDFRPFFHVHLALPLTATRLNDFMAWLKLAVCPPSKYQVQKQQEKQRRRAAAIQNGRRPRDEDADEEDAAAAATTMTPEDTRLTFSVESMFLEETFAGEGRRKCIRLEFATERLRKQALKFLRNREGAAAGADLPPSLRPPPPVSRRPFPLPPPAIPERKNEDYDGGDVGQKRKRTTTTQNNDDDDDDDDVDGGGDDDDAPLFSGVPLAPDQHMDEKGARADRFKRGYETYGGKMPSLHAFYHATELQPTGWVTVSLHSDRVDSCDTWSTRCDMEYDIECAHLRPDPGRLDAASMLAACYDCEMRTSHAGDFPVPVKDYTKPATQIVEMCASHIHGVSASDARVFLRRALEHMFPETPLEAPSAAPEVLDDLPISCVFPKKYPYKVGDGAARAAWIDAHVVMLSQTPIRTLLTMCSGAMEEVIRRLRLAADYEKIRIQRLKEAEAAEEEGGGGGDAEGGGENEASGEANRESTEFFMGSSGDDAGATTDAAEWGGGGGGGSSPMEEMLVKTGLPLHKVTFLDVLRAELDTDGPKTPAPAASAYSATVLFSNASSTVVKLSRAVAPEAKQAEAEAEAEEEEEEEEPQRRKKRQKTVAAAVQRPVVVTQKQKTQVLNLLLTLCLPALEGDPITQIGTVFERIDTGAWDIHLVNLGDCAPIPACTVHAVPDERALLLAWSALMREKRPHALLTFNGFGFDNRYCFLRARELGIEKEVFDFGRKKGCNGIVTDWKTGVDGLAVNQCRLATGDYNMERPDLPGVFQFDALFYFRREHPSYKSYSLDSVAAINLYDSVSAMDLVARADYVAAAPAAAGRLVQLLDWNDPLTVRPLNDAQTLLRLETENIDGLNLGNFICLQLSDGQLSENYLSKAAWRAVRLQLLQKKDCTTNNADEDEKQQQHGDARHKIQVLGIEKSVDGKRLFLLVDPAVADAVRYQIGTEAAERQSMLAPAAAADNTKTTAASEVKMEKSPLDKSLASSSSSSSSVSPLTTPYGQTVPSLGAGVQWCLAKDDVPHTEIRRLSMGSADDRAVVGKYCVGDCTLPLILARKLGVVAWYMETASLCCVDVATLVFNGQGVKLQSYVGKACRANRTLLRDLEKEAVAYDAALVLEPRTDAYNDQPVVVDDFSSLYPSLMAGYNLSPGTRCWSVSYRLGSVPGPKANGPNLTYWEGGGLGAPFAFEGVLKPAADRRAGESPFLHHGLPGREYIYVWYTIKVRVPNKNGGGGKEKSVPVGNHLVCWLMPPFADTSFSATSHPQLAGVYPQQALGLLAARGEKKKLQKNPQLSEFERAVYKLQELVVKTSNNSVYGQLGSTTSALRDLDVAASICSLGRMHILYTKALVERVYADRVVNIAPFGQMRTRSCYVYGDTDSVFMCFNLETVDRATYPAAYVPPSPNGGGGGGGDGAPFTPRQIRGRVALQCAIVLGQNIARLVTDTGPEPMGLAYEKTMMNFFIVSKKKYAGYLHVLDPDKGKLKMMGLQVKKRDSCDCVRDVFGTIMQQMLQSPAGYVQTIQRFLTQKLQSIIGGEVPARKFLITKTLKSGYAKPLQVPHNVLADRIEKRAPGTRPKPGDRVTYLFVVPEKGVRGMGSSGALLAGQRIDTLEYVQATGQRIDYETYVRKHIMQPVVQLLTLLVDGIVECMGLAQDKRELACARENAAKLLPDLVEYNKRMKLAATRLVERILFEPFLLQLTNRTKGNQAIDKFFSRGGGGGENNDGMGGTVAAETGDNDGDNGAAKGMPQLGPTIYRVAGTGSSSSSSNAKKRPLASSGLADVADNHKKKQATATMTAGGKLQCKMKDFFRIS